MNPSGQVAQFNEKIPFTAEWPGKLRYVVEDITVAVPQLGKHCFGCELDSGYTAVVLERMKNLDVEPVKLMIRMV